MPSFDAKKFAVDISASKFKKSTHSSVRATLFAEGGGVFRDRRVSRSVLSRLESRQIARQIEGATIFDEISYPRWKLIPDSRIVFEARVSRQIVYRVKYGILTFRFYIVKAGLYFIYTI